MTLHLSAAGYDFLEQWEQCRLKAYRDRGKTGRWTIGYGHTGPEVGPGLYCTQTQAEAWLRSDVHVAEDAVNRLVKVPLTQPQFDALVSFAFNVGVAAFARSTLLLLLNAGDAVGAAGQFDRWIYDDGEILEGLVNRRAAERRRFESQDLPSWAPSLLSASRSPPPGGSLFSAIASGFSTWLSHLWRGPNGKGD